MDILERTASIILRERDIITVPAAYVKEGDNIYLVKFDKEGNVIEKEYIGKALNNGYDKTSFVQGYSIVVPFEYKE